MSKTTPSTGPRAGTRTNPDLDLLAGDSLNASPLRLENATSTLMYRFEDFWNILLHTRGTIDSAACETSLGPLYWGRPSDEKHWWTKRVLVVNWLTGYNVQMVLS